MPAILIVSSNPEFAAPLCQHLQTVFGEDQCVNLLNATAASQWIDHDPSVRVVWSDLYINGEDHREWIFSNTIGRPSITWGVLSEYDLSEVIDRFFPAPVLSAPQDPEALVACTHALLEDLSGTSFGHFQIIEPRGQLYSGRLYHAYQPAIKREVRLTVCWSHATQHERAFFREAAASLAKVNHPLIYTIYETGEVQGRLFVAQEPISAPTLAQLAAEGRFLEPRLVCKVLHTAAAVLGYFKLQQINHNPIAAHRVTVAPDGVVRVLNIALPGAYHPLPETEQISRLARLVRSVIPQQVRQPEPIETLLASMEAGTCPLHVVAQQAEEIALALSPVKVTPKREQQRLAELEMAKARRNYWIALGSGAAALAVLVGLVLFFVVLPQVAPLKWTDFQSVKQISGGEVVISSRGIQHRYQVDPFDMDEFEVTIGQYKAFFDAVEAGDPGADMAKLLADVLPPNPRPLLLAAPTVNTFKPTDWDEILQAIRNKVPYKGVVPSMDMPMFNINFIQALGYARWKGRDLPDEAQWIRAAQGDDKTRIYPWGAEFGNTERAWINTDADFPRPGSRVPGGSIDGFEAHGLVNAFPNDSSFFGVKAMGGNVREWVWANRAEGNDNTLGPEDMGVRGGSFASGPIAIAVRQSNLRHKSSIQIGFRTVSARTTRWIGSGKDHDPGKAQPESSPSQPEVSQNALKPTTVPTRRSAPGSAEDSFTAETPPSSGSKN